MSDPARAGGVVYLAFETLAYPDNDAEDTHRGRALVPLLADSSISVADELGVAGCRDDWARSGYVASHRRE